MKKNHLLVLLIFLLSSCTPTHFEVDHIKYFVTNNEKMLCRVVGIEMPERGKIIIPATVECGGETYKVTEIRDSAFKNCEVITSVVIPNSVEKIGVSAFENCKAITSINMSDSVKEIGESAFYGCM